MVKRREKYWLTSSLPDMPIRFFNWVLAPESKRAATTEGELPNPAAEAIRERDFRDLPCKGVPP
jgi:hypothetical protein